MSIGYNVIRPYLRMRMVRGHESPLQFQTRTIRGPDACGHGLSADVKLVDPHTSDVWQSDPPRPTPLRNTQTLNMKQNKPARMPNVRYMCRMDVEREARAKPNIPTTQPVMLTTRDPYRVIATPMKIPAQQQQQHLYKAQTTSRRCKLK